MKLVYDGLHRKSVGRAFQMRGAEPEKEREREEDFFIRGGMRRRELVLLKFRVQPALFNFAAR